MNVRLLETLNRPEVKGQFGDVVDLPDGIAMALIQTGFAEGLSAAATEEKSAGPPTAQSAQPAPVSKAQSSKPGRHAPKKSRKAAGK